MDMEARLRAVERRVGRWRAATVALGVVVAALLVREAVPAVGANEAALPAVVRAARFEVVNDDGTIAARLGRGIFNSGDLTIAGYSKPFSLIRSIQLYGAGIAFHSKTIDPSVDMSQILVTIGADANGGLFAIYNGEEKLSVGGRATEAGVGELTVADADGRPLVRLGADAADATASIVELFAGGDAPARRLRVAP